MIPLTSLANLPALGLSLPNVPLLMRMAKILGTLAESLYRDFYSTFRQDEAANPPKQ